MIIYPDKPWVDGQTFTHTTEQGLDLIGTYDESKNTWTFGKGTELEAVYTTTVYTVDVRPSEAEIEQAAAQFEALPLPNPDGLVTQQDVNWYLFDLINNVDGNHLWIGLDEPPKNNAGEYLFKFWWKDDEEQLYFFQYSTQTWVLTGLMDFDRPPIIVDGEPTEHPKFPGKPIKDGDFWFDQSLQQLYVWNDDQWLPVSGLEFEGIANDIGQLTARVDEGETVQEQIQSTVSDALNTQSEIQQDVSTLEAKVEALEGTVTDGTWRLTSRATPLQGEFDLLDGTGAKINGNWALAEFIYLTSPDYQSVEHTFEFIGLEDYIRIGGTGGSAVYRVKSGKTGTSALVEYQVEYISSEGAALDSIVYDFEFAPGFDPSAYATKAYVDTAVEPLATKEYVDNNLGGYFQTKYDGDRTTLSTGGNSQVMNSGEVMYLDAAFNITTNPIGVSIIGLPEQDFNWDSCITSGIIMVRAGSLDAGAYQVWKLRKRTGKHVQLWVVPIWTDTSHPLTPGTSRCLFQGVFFE